MACINHRCCQEHLTCAKEARSRSVRQRIHYDFTHPAPRPHGEVNAYLAARVSSLTCCYLIPYHQLHRRPSLLKTRERDWYVPANTAATTSHQLVSTPKHNRHHVDQRLHPVPGRNDAVDWCLQHFAHKVPGMPC